MSAFPIFSDMYNLCENYIMCARLLFDSQKISMGARRSHELSWYNCWVLILRKFRIGCGGAEGDEHRREEGGSAVSLSFLSVYVLFWVLPCREDYIHPVGISACLNSSMPCLLLVYLK